MRKVEWCQESIKCGPDPACGAMVQQLTCEPVISHNIYCEQRYASADGQRIAFTRLPYRRPQEVWVADLSTQKVCYVMDGTPLAANSLRNAVYIYAEGCLHRLNLLDLSTEEVLQVKGSAPKGTISPDERWFVTGPFPVGDNVYSLHLIDIATGKESVLCEVKDMHNPHLQFDLADSGRLLIQINRGGQASVGNTRHPLSGPLGATLSVVSVPDGEVTPLPIGVPHTARISGHLCWAGQTGTILCTMAPGVHESMVPGTGVYQITPGEAEPRPIVLGETFNHIAASDDGKYVIVDNYHTLRIYIGSVATGTFRELCQSHTRQGRPQHTHVHPYMTPDNQHVIFNSNTTGISQLYSARLPEGFLESLQG